MAARSKQKPDYSALKELFQHHIDSYNYLIAAGLGFVTESVNPVQVYDPNSNNKIRNILFL
ncbi:DNA-directed RNA polymerase I subunit RPA2, partial [Dionaea muscipula]